jgi:hypothetical protein
MLHTASWLNGGAKTIKFVRASPYADGSMIPGANYSAQDNHAEVRIAGL